MGALTSAPLSLIPTPTFNSPHLPRLRATNSLPRESSARAPTSAPATGHPVSVQPSSNLSSNQSSIRATIRMHDASQLAKIQPCLETQTLKVYGYRLVSTCESASVHFLARTRSTPSVYGTRHRAPRMLDWSDDKIHSPRPVSSRLPPPLETSVAESPVPLYHGTPRRAMRFGWIMK